MSLISKLAISVAVCICLDAQNGTKRLQNPGPARCRYKSACFLRCVVGLSSAVALVHMWLLCAVIGSGARIAMVATADNASRIGKAFMK